MTGFKRALDHVLQYEGLYSNHPSDPGGATMRGVTQRTYDSFRRDKGLPVRPVKDISMLEVEQVYFENYWLKVGAHQLPPALGFVVFDSAVHSGVNQALKWLEGTRDWRVYVAHRLQFLTDLDHWPTFGRGWARRMASLIRVAVELDQGETPDSAKQLLVFDEAGKQAAHVRFADGDLLIRVRGNRVYVRPDT